MSENSQTNQDQLGNGYAYSSHWALMEYVLRNAFLGAGLKLGKHTESLAQEMNKRRIALSFKAPSNSPQRYQKPGTREISSDEEMIFPLRPAFQKAGIKDVKTMKKISLALALDEVHIHIPEP